jgi:hypothetical protein
MTSFPIFTGLKVSDYGLFPGSKDKSGLDVTFQNGLTLVLGANGLGKTTLVTMLYRLCTGQFDIPGLAGRAELGTLRLEAKELRPKATRLFADRVNDHAENSVAGLTFRLGEAQIDVKRTLRDLKLVGLAVDGEELAPQETRYQHLIRQHAGVSTFGDWILLLQHLTFYFEERRALVWDPTAQRQIFRVLFLAPLAASEWTERERDVLQRDSAVRNLQATLGREERSFAAAAQAASTSGDVRAELQALEDLQNVDGPRLEQLNDGLADLSANRQSSRLAALRAESEHESASRALERLQLVAIASAFPEKSETAQYLLTKLVSDGECLACGTRSQTLSDELKSRSAAHRCVVCDSPLEGRRGRRPTKSALAKASAALDVAARHLLAATERRDQVDAEFADAVSEIDELDASVTQRSARIEQLVKRLPPDEAKIHKQQDAVEALRGRAEVMKRELGKRRRSFGAFVERTSKEIVEHKQDIQDWFEQYARGFLLEDCKLVWSPHQDRIGETGPLIDFPAFELDMSGTDFASPVRRSGPEQVSESQREFIDLAFRMALIHVAGTGGVGSLVIDAPESSLDAVFVSRAADVLSRFAKESENRLLVTSNLVEGKLVPELMRKNGATSAHSRRIVDLLSLAAPTAATSQLAPEYEAVRRALFKEAAAK